MPQLADINAAVNVARPLIDEVRKLLANGNCNPYLGVPGSQLRSPSALIQDEVNKKRSVVNFATTQLVVDPIRETLCDAKIAIGAKCGNCGEHASVAFAQLFRQGISHIQKVYYPIGAGDHAFVFIHSADGQTALCDPWSGWWGDVAQCWNLFATAIWGALPPNPPQVHATCNTSGSEWAYDLLTAGQHSYDSMNLSN